MADARIPNVRAYLITLVAVLATAGVMLGLVLVAGHSKAAHGTPSAVVTGSSAPASPGSTAPSALAEAIRTNVVRVHVTNSSCSSHREATGFAYAPERVLTTAHLVAGSRGAVTVTGGNGTPYRGTAVVFDPDRDVAVLEVPGLDAQSIDFGPVDRGANVTIAAYADGGSFFALPAIVQNRSIAYGPNIYQEGQVLREVLHVHGQRPLDRGTPGGPVISADGKLAGMLFAADLETDEDGYALSFREIAPRMMDGLKATKATSTQQCSR